MKSQESSDDLSFLHYIPEYSDDETDSDTNDRKSESSTRRGFRAGVGSGYKNHHTPSLSVTQSPSSMPSSFFSSTLSGRAGTPSLKRALEFSHLYPEFPRKRATYSDSSAMFLGQESLELQKDERPSVVMSCAKHSSDQKLDI
ncbi:hypothetical protein AJ78_06761 [Emergomyces pasteurianus Ep9510]|uniref:Uncharacterized protein n=1 Tax=Emergomyces pasteurianus Ep9510 TaxID=1447872 RepID=A0A1J9PXR3_9EURO|nr:hypothetical protein AJ78_06761 [Emergomyces pasteurianus Ep9510]